MADGHADSGPSPGASAPHRGTLTWLFLGAVLISCLPSTDGDASRPDPQAAEIHRFQVTAEPGTAPAPDPTPDWRRYGAPETGMYVGWFGKPNSVNGGGFTEVFSGGRADDASTANQPALINATLDWVQNRLGRQPSLFHIYEAAGGKADFPATVADACARRQQLLMVSLSLGSDTAQALAQGSGDALWRNWAQGAKAWGRPVILRWGWEAPIQPWARDPAAYKAAWLRMHRIVKQEVGAANVKLAFTPVYFYTGWGTYKDYFPGNEYVDWVGVDDYQPPDMGFEDTIQAPYDWFAQHAPGKPFIVAEWGMKHTSDDGQTTYAVPAYPNDWYSRTLAAAKTRPNIKAYVIFDFDQEINSALSPTWPGTLHLQQQLRDPFYLQQAPVL